MKVALVHRRLQPSGLGGGVSRLYFELGQAMARIGVEVCLVTGEPAWRDDRCDVVSLANRESRSGWRAAVADALCVMRPDIAECHIWRAELATLASRRRSSEIRIVVRCDLGSAHFGDDDEASIERRLVREADVVIAVSSAVERFVEDWARVVAPVVPLGVVPPRPLSQPSHRFHLRRALWIGRPTSMKGFDRLLEIANALPTWTFTAVLGPSISQIETGGCMPGNLSVLSGLTEDELEALRARHDFIMCTARFEGFGLSILEGMASGLVPVVTPDCGGPLDFVKDGESGVVFSSAQGLASEADRVVLPEIANNASQVARQHSWERTAERSLEAYAV